MNTTVDGEFQRYAVESGAYIREHFFGPDPRLRKLVEHLTDDDLRNLPRGGHDYRKLYAAYKAATEQVGAPTVILAKTVKGWTLGPDVEGRNATHQIKKMTKAQLKTLRDRLHLRTRSPSEALDGDDPPYYRPARGLARVPLPDRAAHGARRPAAVALGHRAPRRCTLPPPEPFAEFDAGSGTQAVSTTMAFTRLLRNLARDEGFGPRVVPIIPDEARTFGMDALFREFKIYAADRASATSPSTTTCCCPTPRARTARSSRRASPRPARWPASPPPARPTPTVACRWCRSSSSTRCSASSGSAT